jgi:hypothetical protein
MLTAAKSQNSGRNTGAHGGRRLGGRYGVVALACAAVAIFVLGLASALVFTFVLVRPAEAGPGAAKADGNPANLNPAAIAYTLPNQLKWVTQPNGAINAVLRGDPSKPGPYIVLTKWTAHHMSRPHFHPNDRFVVVLSGTWWVGTGTKYDPDSTVPMPTGTFATHYGKQIHYDGAKDEDVVLEIVGEGPATQVAAEEK